MNAETEVNTLFEQMDSTFFKALAEPVRIEILKKLIMVREADIHTIAKDLPQDRSVISRHLSILEEAKVVSMRKDGRHRIYTIQGDQFIERFEAITQTIKRCMALDCC
ncbi:MULTISPECIES: ArsR/SmtB family transcription factor [Kordiimonas]|jgi:DNA-binding transcriptional ArsR family regulator|uniref:DNA-binding transcriptional regulator, ArsR family n=1 Tax=Kordiimonas lacus TaxID=637679 RepID=A0A1G6Y2S1_9PROT|nr:MULTISPECIES: metalloregulator ArsR/SmtB family transcription factor [Kordiimonas]SDD84027.1 DNA-binding transcriptional regulator, ArsR family [Kordiimonas lacus]